ncbi:MAG: DEAD/DEAH box helicase family protein [Eubacteriales bacterium]|nr:DEAD/DEAH box helicase family protein [Eubacteriales bacterium]
MITKSRDKWYESSDCTVKSLIDYIISTNQMRDAQIDAIKTYLFLKIACNCKSLYSLFIDGKFNNINLDEEELTGKVRTYLKNNKAACALYEYATLTNSDGEQVSKKIEEQIKSNPDSIDYNQFFADAFYGVTYSDYLFSLPMGAGKTYLMATFIYLDLYFAKNEPSNKAFAHNFIIFAPSGLKSSVVPSLKTIQNFNPAWILPEPAATDIKRMIMFEVLDQNKTANKSNKTKNPNVQKIASHQPLEELFGLVAVTNAEKVILDRIQEKKGQIYLFEDSEDEKDRQANELRNLIGKLPSLSIFIDEVHHAVSDEIKLRAVVNDWIEKNNSVNSVIGFSGTPYLEKAEKINVVDKLKVSTAEITNIVYYYPLVDGVCNFLKKPIIKITENATSAEIIDKGVREFLDKYKDKTYSNGLSAKLGVYCGTIEKLEELVYPLVSSIIAEYNMPTDCILKYHKGNKQYPMPADSQMGYESLDKTISKTRIILLVQIGKEGWDCRSLTGIILSQEGDCPKNMVLQTSCRCLRQVDKDTVETALICLNDDNASKLESQLKQQHHISLNEFLSADNRKTEIKRYDRTSYLKLPKIDFYQLKINFETLIVENLNTSKDILHSTDNTKLDYAITRETDLSMEYKGITVDDKEKGSTYTTYTMWLYDIVKGSFGTLTMEQLHDYDSELKTIFDLITYDNNGVICFSSKYNILKINSNIRKSFIEKRYFSTTEETIPETASLLNIANFTDTVKTDIPEKYIPKQDIVKNIIDSDKGKLKLDKKVLDAIDALRAIGQNEQADALERGFALPANTDRTYHYLPYRVDSSFESKFYNELSINTLLKDLDLEIYYNGDSALTEFKIRCYKSNGGKWSYIGIYTPDFLIIKRKDGKIYKAIIVETKGEIYANDPKFKDKKCFMETEFVNQNNKAFGYKRFDYLYLEDTQSENERITLTHQKIREFFKEE